MRMNRLGMDIEKLKVQKQVLQSRMKCERQQHILWRKRWNARLKELTKQGATLQKQNAMQGRLLEKKTKEAEVSAKKGRRLEA